jgi:class 3 adenylate cyclase
MGDKVRATILFVDIMDSMEIANYWEARKYNNFLNDFQDVMLRGIEMDTWGYQERKTFGR